MIEKEERLFSFQHEMFHDIVWGLGAMAAERVVYGENSNGVGGDVAGVTARAALMETAAITASVAQRAQRSPRRHAVTSRVRGTGAEPTDAAAGHRPGCHDRRLGHAHHAAA